MKIPEINWQNFQIGSNGHPELGIPAQYLTQPINKELHKHQGLIRNTHTEKIELDTPTITLNTGGFTSPATSKSKPVNTSATNN